jgi:predicted PurR-regulated permease PerM
MTTAKAAAKITTRRKAVPKGEIEAAATGDAGPTDIADPLLKTEAKKAIVWLGMAALIVFAVFSAQPLLVVFAGMVFAAIVDGGARLLGRVAPMPRAVRVTFVVLAGVAFLGWVLVYAGGQIAAEAALLQATVKEQAIRVIAWLQQRGIAVDFGSVQTLVTKGFSSVGQVKGAVGGIIGGFTTLFLIAVLGVYIAAEPRLYQRGIAWMMPAAERDRFHETAALMGKALRMLMFGRILGMIIEGVATGVLLAIYGVPLAGLLGLLTGLLAFLPNIGAPISGALMILVGFSGGTDMGLYCVAVYIGVQFLDSNVIIPLVAKKTVDLAPALVLAAQLVMGALFGILGLALADPLVAMIKIALERHAAKQNPA